MRSRFLLIIGPFKIIYHAAKYFKDVNCLKICFTFFLFDYVDVLNGFFILNDDSILFI
jgi:hypothetical protein